MESKEDSKSEYSERSGLPGQSAVVLSLLVRSVVSWLPVITFALLEVRCCGWFWRYTSMLWELWALCNWSLVLWRELESPLYFSNEDCGRWHNGTNSVPLFWSLFAFNIFLGASRYKTKALFSRGQSEQYCLYLLTCSFSPHLCRRWRQNFFFSTNGSLLFYFLLLLFFFWFIN